MGTRGLSGFKLDGQQILSYQQYDSYPTGVGAQMLEFAADLPVDIREQVAALRLVAESDEPTAAEREQYAEFFEQVSTGKDWYATLRKLQGDLPGYLNAGIMVRSGYSFWPDPDGWDIEYVYIVNLDDNSFEAYSGETLIASWPLNGLPSQTTFERTFELADA